jgi:hypothetical protein
MDRDRDRFISNNTSAALEVAVIEVLVMLVAVKWRLCEVLLLLGASVPPSVCPSVCLSVRPSVRLSVRPHGATRLPPDKYTIKLIFEEFSKLSGKFKFH